MLGPSGTGVKGDVYKPPEMGFVVQGLVCLQE